MGNGAYGADSKLIDSLPSLEIIASHSVGLDQIDLVGCREKGIRITYTPDILTDEVTNLEILLVLATLRKIYECVCYVRSGLWIKNGDFKLTTKVSCGSRSIRLRYKNSAKVKEWVTAINEVALRPLEGWCHPHRFGSYAPPRGLTEDGSHAQWFVDGRAAFEPIALAIEGAKSEIFICGWWVCPELYLRRPFHAHASSRLDALLESKAKEGVQDLDLSVDLSAASAAAP